MDTGVRNFSHSWDGLGLCKIFVFGSNSQLAHFMESLKTEQVERLQAIFKAIKLCSDLPFLFNPLKNQWDRVIFLAHTTHVIGEGEKSPVIILRFEKQTDVRIIA